MCPPVLVGTQCVLWADTQVRPYSGLHVSSLYVLLCQQRTPSDSTLAVRPYTNRHVMSWGISVLLRASVVSQRYVPSRDARSVRPSPSKVIALAGGMYASLHWATRLVLSVSFFVSLGLRNNNLIKQDSYGDTFFRGVPH